MLKVLRNLYSKLKRLKKNLYLQSLIDDGMFIGKSVDIVDSFFFDRAHCHLISIGDNTTIAPGVSLIAHDASSKKYLGYSRFGKIDIQENCFIGHSSMVLYGVTIGANSIVGAGSIVTKSVPPNSVVAGVPARRICSLEDYLSRLEVKPGQKIFGVEYDISNLTDERRRELKEVADKGVGFIE